MTDLSTSRAIVNAEGRPPAQARAAELRHRGRTVVLIDPAADDFDAPLAVMAALASQLERIPVSTELASRFEDQMPFDRRLELLRDSLDAVDTDVMFVLEAPGRWGGRSRGARDRCARILATIRDAGAAVEVCVQRPDETLAQALLQLAGEVLENTAPLRHPSRPPSALAAAVLGRMTSGGGRRIRAELAVFGAYRDWHQVLASAPVPARLRGLVEIDGEYCRLAWEVRSALRDTDAVTGAHRHRALRRHVEALTAARSTGDPARHRLLVEAAAAAACLGDAHVLDEVGVIGSEQLNLLARTLASRPVDVGRAQDIAERAVAADAKDIDAIRTLVALVDDSGDDLDQARSLWQMVIEGDPADQEAHEALISLLLTAADEQAARDAYHMALLDLEHGEPADAGRLHLPVAATALQRSRTGFARDVLFDVPPAQRRPPWKAMVDVLEGLEAAQRDEDFLPIGQMSSRWWEAGPRLLASRDPVDDARLTTWVAGRIAAVEEGVAVVEGAAVDLATGGHPVDETLMLSREDYQRVSGDQVSFDDLYDRYIEFGVYRTSEGSERALLRIHPRSAATTLPLRRDPRRSFRDAV